MMRLTVFPYMADEVKFDDLLHTHRLPNPINEEYFDIKGFDLGDDGTLSFVMVFVGGKFLKRAATIKLDKSQIFQLRKVLEGHKFPQGNDSGRIGISVNSG